MRRQVKPFVTEYRGSGRRRDTSPHGDLGPETPTPRSRSFAEADRAFHTDPADDSYEAALRAADALFSPSSPSVAAADMRAPEARPFQTMQSSAAIEEAPAPVATPAERDAIPPSRRILQAIEPPTEDRFAALEAERAPKRRGRKPGSKNKPKIAVGDDWPAPARPAAASVAALPATTSASPPVLAPSLADLEPDGEDPSADAPQPRGRNDKFGWKRHGLRPGERWKRRLPKAAW